MNERIAFIGRLLNGEKMTDVCLEYGISRVTGYKVWNRYLEDGLPGLSDRSSRPHTLARATDPRAVKLILDLKKTYPSWGAPKIWSYLKKKEQRFGLPVQSTVHEILDRNGLVKRRRRRDSIYKSVGTDLTKPTRPNELWCTDFKGQFRLKNTKYCYPLTITDNFSRYLICCEALESTKVEESMLVYRRVFEEFGLPKIIKSDNGVPFGTKSLFGLSKLSVWWLLLGIKLERIVPGHPEQNGQHERMHKTLKAETTNPPGKGLLQQQEMFDHFVSIFNDERPHEGIQMQTPSSLYIKSDKNYTDQLGSKNIDVVGEMRRVSNCGKLSIGSQRSVFISEVFANQELEITREENEIWSVSFLSDRIGFYDETSLKFTPVTNNPFLRKGNINSIV